MLSESWVELTRSLLSFAFPIGAPQGVGFHFKNDSFLSGCPAKREIRILQDNQGKRDFPLPICAWLAGDASLRDRRPHWCPVKKD